MTFFAWQADSRLLSLDERLAPAIERYFEKNGGDPDVLVVNPVEAGVIRDEEGFVTVKLDEGILIDLLVRGESYVSPGTYYLGSEG